MTDILSVVKLLKIPHCLPGEHHHVREGWIGLNCPWCPRPSSRKGQWRLGIEIATGRTNCWSCGGRPLFEAIALLARISTGEVASLLQGVRFKYVQKPKKTGSLKTPRGAGPLAQAHRDYLSNRGFDPLTIERLWGVQGIGIAARLQWRLFIPVFLDGEVVSWTTRRISSTRAERRYISASPVEESIPLKETLYGIDLARSTIIIVEGPTDCWRIGPGAVGTFGTAITKAQVNLMSRFPRRVICLDSEDAAQRVAQSLLSTLSALPGETVNIELEADDPGSASLEEVEEIRRIYL